MSWRRSAAIARLDLRIAKRDTGPLIFMVVMPLLVMAFVKPAFRFALAAAHPGANGSEQAVPGMVVMFGFFAVGATGFTFFREHGWNTWDRLRASWATPTEIMLGKLVTPLLLTVTQVVVLFGLGHVLYGLHVRGSLLALAVVSVALIACLLSLALMLVAVMRTVQQMNAAANVGGLVFAGFGGSLTPLSIMPHWVRAVAPATPGYWAMRGFRSVFLDGQGLHAALPAVGVLAAFTAAFALVAALRFRMAEPKTSWA
jgi:ABC-2 type transport system permease protein